MVHEVKTDSELTEAIAKSSSQLVVVDFYADWCGPCKAIAPKVAKLAEEKSAVAFFKVNVDVVSGHAQVQTIEALPTFRFYKNGVAVDEMKGAMYDQLVQLVNKHSA
jgi:thioredoxin 1